MATLTGKRVKDTYKDLLQVSNSNSGIDATMRVVSDGEATDSVLYLSSAGVAVNSGLNIGAATAVTGGKVTQTASLAAATGDEVAYSLAYTTNKASSGADTGLQIVQTDTASPGTSYLINAKVGATSKFSVDNDGACNLASNLKLQGVVQCHGSLRVQVPDGGSYQFWADHTKTWIDDDLQYVWGSTYNTQDTGLARAAAAVVKVTDASTGYGALSLDTNSAQYADTVTLTDNVLTALFDVALVDTAMAGGTFHYTIKCVDATPNYQVEQGTVNFMAFNKAAAYTTDFNVASSQILGSGTLATTFSITTGTNLITMNVTSNSSLTPTAFTLTYQLFLNHSGAVTKKT